MTPPSSHYSCLFSFSNLGCCYRRPCAEKNSTYPCPHSNARFSAELIVVAVAPRWFGVYRTRHRRLASRRWLYRMLCCIHERFLLLIALVIIVGQASSSSSSSSSLSVVVVIIVYIAEQWTGNGKGAAVFDEDCLLSLFESEEYTWTVERRPMPYAQETPTCTRVYGKSIGVY
jgi:hypothetical protein